jgi:hypothetical protein
VTDGSAAPLMPEPCGDARDAGTLAELAARLGEPVPPRLVLQGAVERDD